MKRWLFVTTVMAAFVPFKVLLAQTPDQISLVRTKVLSANYIIRGSTNGCPLLENPVLGWPAGIVKKCIYRQDGLTALAYIVDIKPEILAKWVENACQKFSSHPDACFNITLACAKFNSGAIYPVSGNIIENSQNIFFRNGITIKPEMDGKIWSFTSRPIKLEDQERFVMMSDADIVKDRPNPDAKSPIPTGLARLWRTRPWQFAKTFPGLGAPSDTRDAVSREAWLGVSKREFLEALRSNENRLLTAWMSTHVDMIKEWPTDQTIVGRILSSQALADKYCPSE